MPQHVTIEIMVDTNANSRKLNREYEELREDRHFNKAIGEFRDYLSHARLPGLRHAVSQRDTAQLFHEKTNLMTPELAKEAGITIKPDFLRANLEQGHYHVEPPIHGEEEYYDALTTFLRRILPDKAPQDMAKLDGMTPENRGAVLQELFRAHMMPLPDRYRKGAYRRDFERYHDVRFNAGEETAFHYLQSMDCPPEGERKAFVFVGSDREANENMARAREGKNDEGRLETFVVSPAKFRQLMAQVIRDIERARPEMRQYRQRYEILSKIDTATVEQKPGSYAIRLRDEVAEVSKEAQSFSDFVTRTAQGNHSVAFRR